MIRNAITKIVIEMIERGWMHDGITRSGIRNLCRKRVRQVTQGGIVETMKRFHEFVADARQQPIAPLSDKANEQHYEVPAAFFDLVLGPRKKYSCCFYEGDADLKQAEEDSLRITCERAQLVDGQDILELGCGWGSLTLWMCEQYPNSKITAVSNSASQRKYIMDVATAMGIGDNLTVITADMNDFDINSQFDRVVSVEMFEHMRNHPALLASISRWLRPDGYLFVHIFCHRDYTYPFEAEGAANWMGRYFFSGGIMPGENLFSHYDDHLNIEQQWTWNGQHYEKTSNDWLKNLDQQREQVLDIMADVYGEKDAVRWMNRWRVFFMACAELFGLDDGKQWYVAHYLFSQADVKKTEVYSPELVSTY